MNRKFDTFKKLLKFCTSNSEIIAYIFLYFFSSYPCLKYVKEHFTYGIQANNNVFCLLLIAVLTIFLPLLYCYCQRHKQLGLSSILPLACICAFASSPSYLHIWTNGMISIFYITGFLAVTYSLFRKWSFLFWYLWLLLPLAATLASMRYQLTVDAHLISEIIGASPQDAAQFITLPNISLISAWLIGTLLLCIAFTLIVRKYTEKQLFIPGVAIIMIAWGTTAATNRQLWSFQSSLAPENCILRIAQATTLAKEANSRIIRIAKALPSPSSPMPVIPEEKQSDASICILHIGESVRSDHLSLFGYNKQTTPNLNKQNNLIAYRDCISAAPTTVPSTFAILTNAKTDVREIGIDPALEASCGGIMDIFHSLGFECYAFMMNENTNQTVGLLYEKLLNLVFASTADKIFTIPNVRDSHSQILQVSNALSSARKEKLFCLINNCGSHVTFYDFNKNAPPFSPASSDAYFKHPDKNRKVAEVLINTYDCTIHYLDEYINKLLTQLKGKPFIYIYISDHGEFFGDKGIWVRSEDKNIFFNTPVCQVPFLIITSPEFEQQNPHYVQALQKLREHRDMSIGQEHIFHTLLGIFGIQSPYYEEELDLTSDKVQPYTGPHPSRGGKASDGKKWY